VGLVRSVASVPTIIRISGSDQQQNKQRATYLPFKVILYYQTIIDDNVIRSLKLLELPNLSFYINFAMPIIIVDLPFLDII